MLNPESPLPLYHQLAQILMDQIRSGRYQPGDALMPETVMAGTYGIGRPTVRQAIDVLVRKGLVERKRGSGTFVRQPDQPVDLFSFAGTSQAFLTKGIQPRSTVVDPMCLLQDIDDPSNPFHRRAAYFLSRLTRVNALPVLFETFFLHPDLFSGIHRIDFENRSLSRVVQDQYYLQPDSGRQTFTVCLLPETLAILLELEPGTPILEVERKLDFPGTAEALFSRLYCRTDTFAFSQTMGLKTEETRTNSYSGEK